MKKIYCILLMLSIQANMFAQEKSDLIVKINPASIIANVINIQVEYAFKPRQSINFISASGFVKDQFSGTKGVGFGFEYRFYLKNSYDHIKTYITPYCRYMDYGFLYKNTLNGVETPKQYNVNNTYIGVAFGKQISSFSSKIKTDLFFGIEAGTSKPKASYETLLMDVIFAPISFRMGVCVGYNFNHANSPKMNGL